MAKFDAEAIKRKARERMAAMQASQNLSTELDAVNRRVDHQVKQAAIEEQTNIKPVETKDSPFHAMFDEESTLYPPKTSVPVGQVDSKTGLINDGGSAAQATLERFRKQQAIKAAMGQSSVITKAAIDAINTDSKPFDVPDELRQIEGLNAELFMANLLSVEEGVKNSGENIQDYLRLIHANLTQYPELTHILTDDQIKIIVSGFLTESSTQIKVSTQRGGKSMAKITQGRSKTDLLGLLDLPAF